jgi:hypothetical protein
MPNIQPVRTFLDDKPTPFDKLDISRQHVQLAEQDRAQQPFEAEPFRD